MAAVLAIGRTIGRTIAIGRTIGRTESLPVAQYPPRWIREEPMR